MPHLDGVMVYVTDNWGDRGAGGGYVFPRSDPVWRGGRQLGELASLLQAAVNAQQRDLLFSLWGGTSAWPDFVAAAPSNFTGVVHMEDDGFNVDHSLSDLVAAGAGRNHTLYVAVDPYREWDGGWSRMMAVPAASWQSQLASCKRLGVQGAIAFANWGPGWSWPNHDTHGFLHNCSANQSVSWAGRWLDFRSMPSFPGCPSTTPFTGQEAAAVLAASLMWDSARDPEAVVTHWATQLPLALNATWAGRVAAAATALEAGWALMSKNVGFETKWMAVFNPSAQAPYKPRHSTWAGVEAYLNGTHEAVDAATRLVAGMVTLPPDAWSAGSGVGEAVNAARERLVRGVEMTARFLRAYATFSAANWIHYNLPGPEGNRAMLCKLQAVVLANLTADLQWWATEQPRESQAFQLADLDPNLFTRPVFFRADNNRSMALYRDNIFVPSVHRWCPA